MNFKAARVILTPETHEPSRRGHIDAYDPEPSGPLGPSIFLQWKQMSLGNWGNTVARLVLCNRCYIAPASFHVLSQQKC